MITKLVIPAVQEVGTGAIDDLGTIGEVTYTVPAMPLPTNYQKIEIKRQPDGNLAYIITFEEQELKEEEIA